MLRANISIEILAMVHKSANDPDYGPRYNWSDEDTSMILGAFFVGSCITTFPAGFLAEWYGGTFITAIALIVSTAMTALTPYMSDMSIWSIWSIYANRFVLGLAGGIFFPAMHNVVSKWAPPNEKGKFVAALLGGNLGTVFTFQLSGILTPIIGWRQIFYGQAILVGVLTVLWLVFVSNTPSTHRFISSQEIKYIEESLGSSVSKQKAVPPYLKIFKSVPFLSLLVLHYGNLWGLFFLLTIAPQYMSDALHFDLKKAGILSSLPHLARFLCGFVFGWIGDCLRRKHLNQTRMRKSFCIFSHIIPGLLLFGIPYIQDTSTIVALLTLSLGFNGAATLTNLQNAQDLAPNFAGTIYSIINVVGMTAGVFGPMVKSELTHMKSTYDFDVWTVMFVIGGFGYIVPAALFWIFGSAEIQSWNEITKKIDICTQETQEHQKSHDDTDPKSTGENETEDWHTKF